MPPRIQALRLASTLLKKSTASPIVPVVAPFLLPVQQRCASILASLADNPGAYNKRIRKGRGPASGKGKTAGRGQKGQHAHGKVPRGFEGGQTPQWITNPERGRDKYNPFKVEMSPINLDRIQSWIDQGRLDTSKVITMRELKKSRCLHGVKPHGVKLLGRNVEALTSPINIVVSRASASAIAKVEALGGSVTTRFYSPTSVKQVLRGNMHPIISLQSDATLMSRGLPREEGDLLNPQVLSKVRGATQVEADLIEARGSLDSDVPDAAKTEVMRKVVMDLTKLYPRRLPDATGRKDREYYRDPAHRGYLAYTVKEGESPSLFFKPPKEFKDKRKQTAKQQAAKASADNRLF